MGQWLMPFLAIVTHEIRFLWASWLVRLWLIGTALLAFLTTAGNWGQMSSALLVASLLFSYLVFPWFLVVFMLGISPVTGTRLDALADGILSRPVTRHEYLLAAWVARVLVVLGVFLVVMIPATVIVVAAKRPVPADDVTWYGVIAALGVVSLVLTFLVSVSFLAGTLLRKPLFAVVILTFVWFPISMVMHTFSLEEFSPISLSQALPTLLRTPWKEDALADASRTNAQDLQAISDLGNSFISALTGGAPVKQRPAGFFERGDYKDFALTRVILGYGIPTLAVLGLTLFLFSRRDL